MKPHHVTVPFQRIPFKWVLAGWLVLGAIDAGQSILRVATTGGRPNILEIVGWTAPAYIALALLSPIVFRLAHRVPLERGTLTSSLATHSLASIIFPIVHLPLAALLSTMIGKPGTLQSFLGAWLTFFYGVDVFRYWALVMLYQQIRATAERRLLAVEAEQLRTQSALLRADLSDERLRHLTRQLEPHFLFNALNVVSGFALRREPEAAATMITNLSNLLRRALQHNSEREVSLETELDFTTMYLDIEQARMGPRLNYQIDVDNDVLHVRVPSMLLQPLVENSIRHGLEPDVDGGNVRIEAKRQGNTLVIRVIDDGAGINARSPDDALATGIGLQNTKLRLEHIYANTATVDVMANSPRGVIVTITLPL